MPREQILEDFEYLVSILLNDNTSDTVLFRGQRIDLLPIPKLGRINLERDLVAAEQQIITAVNTELMFEAKIYAIGENLSRHGDISIDDVVEINKEFICWHQK